MIVVFAIDGLEITLVEKYNNQHLKQKFFGKTNISEFSQPRTMVLWSSFMTGQNKEKEVLAKGNEKMWSIEWPLEETFFAKFKKPKIIDLPGFNFDTGQHNRQRKLLAEFFNEKDQDKKEKTREKYNQLAFKHHKKIKKEFLDSLDKNYDFLLGYFGIFDLIGHLNFGNHLMIKMIYQELDEIGTKIEKKADKIIVLSDHGMTSKGMFGDHADYGFWSTNFKDLNNPKIIDFAKIITEI